MNDGLPPPNRAIGWYRFLLWVMPTCIAITSVFGLGWLAQQLAFRNGDIMVMVWWGFNLAAVIGVGTFELKFQRRRDRIAERAGLVMMFVLLQFLIVPVLCCVIAFGFCLVTGA